MLRTFSITAVAVLAATALWMRGGPAPAEAKPKPKPKPVLTCKQEVAKLRVDLATASADLRDARAETAAVRAELDKMIAAERERIRRLEESIGQPIKTLK